MSKLFRPTPDYTQLVQVNEMKEPKSWDYNHVNKNDADFYFREDYNKWEQQERSLLRYPIASPGDEYWRSKSEFELDKDFMLDNTYYMGDVQKIAHPVAIQPVVKEENNDWMCHPLYDEIHDQLKQEGYSTGSEGDYDKLMNELKRRIEVLCTPEQPEKQTGPILDIRDAAILEETISVLKWMMESHTVDDKSLQSDSFNRPMNAINGLEYILERPIMNIPPSAQGETFSREFVQGFAEWILNDAHVTGGADNMWWDALNHRWLRTSQLLDTFINDLKNKKV